MRKIIERSENGQMKYHLKGIDEFAEKVAKELCEKYPEVDFFDLEFVFKRQFEFQMSIRLLEYSATHKAANNQE